MPSKAHQFFAEELDPLLQQMPAYRTFIADYEPAQMSEHTMVHFISYLFLRFTGRAIPALCKCGRPLIAWDEKIPANLPGSSDVAGV
jgi:hypothetical protein